jgi:penicillin-binding protein 1C
LVVGSLPAFLLCGVVIGAFLVDVPEPLRRTPVASRYIRDRHGVLLARTRGEGNEWFNPLERGEMGGDLVNALLAAEDARFYSHPGIDVLAIGRALFSSLQEGRITSGASTITQQLARTSLGRAPTVLRKLREMSVALRLEAEYSKDELLELYVNHVHFGPQVLGLRAASERYFGKEPRELDLSEAATLAGLLRGPTLYDLERRPHLALRRRNRVLARLQNNGVYPKSTIERALGTPLRLHPRPPWLGAKHWVRAILRRAPADATEVHTPLDHGLQRELERIARAEVLRLQSFEASALSIIVIDNRSSEILAYVGSPDFSAVDLEGQVDGVVSLRQPGSTLKPFLYAAAIDQLGLDPDSELDDEPLSFIGPEGYWSPENYDRKFRGVVSLRRALANSLNVPAVTVLSRLGLERGLRVLHGFGFESLDKSAEHYGHALALGAGEVTLLELATAYSSLARGGSLRSARWLTRGPEGADRVACTPRAAGQISEVLADSAARREVFGAHNDFDFPFWAATKTGTSKGYRDAWALGYTHDITVGVWVGNFDGRPMRLGTGAGSAGPIFHQTLTRAVQRLSQTRVQAPDPGRHTPQWQAAAKVPSHSPPTLIFPKGGMTFAARRPGGPDPEIRVRALRLGPTGYFWIDGQKLPAGQDGELVWRATRGKHEIFAESAEGERSEPVWVSVE